MYFRWVLIAFCCEQQDSVFVILGSSIPKWPSAMNESLWCHCCSLASLGEATDLYVIHWREEPSFYLLFFFFSAQSNDVKVLCLTWMIAGLSFKAWTWFVRPDLNIDMCATDTKEQQQLLRCVNEDIFHPLQPNTVILLFQLMQFLNNIKHGWYWLTWKTNNNFPNWQHFRKNISLFFSSRWPKFLIFPLQQRFFLAGSR